MYQSDGVENTPRKVYKPEEKLTHDDLREVYLKVEAQTPSEDLEEKEIELTESHCPKCLVLMKKMLVITDFAVFAGRIEIDEVETMFACKNKECSEYGRVVVDCK